ncbi:energy transducer TonB [Parerythrobacter aestuarii]|uniref:energy transducer TonB n=1 Tax=Parerythrobacter aestuarii TaxID=3020909 RepID=UPI0024DE38CE|nr:TonB family protein [Parerythrobacter aestuarii]
MAYVDTRGSGNRTQAIIGVAAIHAALGVVIVTGLAANVEQIIKDPPLIGKFVTKPVEPPPPPADPQDTNPTTPKDVFTPKTPFDIPTRNNPINTTTEQQPWTPPDTGSMVDFGTGGGIGKGIDLDPPKLFEPVAPKARNGDWVTDNDYRTSWITREWEGTAGFRLTIGTNGKVTNCTITNSTGYAALDKATCSLVTRRAKFDPARNDQGETVSGTFSSAVLWQIPD